MLARLGVWFDDRLGASRFARTALNKVFPDHWSFMLGEVAFYCFLILVATGTYLTFFFHPSAQEVVYHGAYGPLRGVSMTEAYRSTVALSFDVRAGLVIRQIHHWTALLFAASVVAHLGRIFFTGAFRRPRELNWIIGVTLLAMVLFNGFTGYSLPDDLLSGTGLRIAYSVALSIPVVGTWLAFLAFGGEFPAADITSRLFVIHILLIPGAIALLLGAHLFIIIRQKHTQFPGPGRTERNVVGSRLWPTYAVKSVGLGAVILAFLCALGGLAQINPVWLYGPFDPAAVSTAAQPDWYLGWVEGALRIWWPWDFHVFGHTISEVFLPGVVIPGITFVLLYAWPFLERRVTRDGGEHHLLDWPRHRPVRTALGVATLTFYVVLLSAGAQDLFAQALHVSIASVTLTFRLMLVVGPLATGLFTWKLCRDLSARDRLEATEEAEQMVFGTATRAANLLAPALEPAPVLGALPAAGGTTVGRPRRGLSAKAAAAATGAVGAAGAIAAVVGGIALARRRRR